MDHHPQRGSVTTQLIVAFVVLVALIGAVAGLIKYGERQGRAEVQAKWDAAVREAEELAAGDGRFGRLQADLVRQRLHELEKRYAATNILLSQAMRTKVDCPASGEIGDVVLPADMVRGMFNIATGDQTGTSGR